LRKRKSCQILQVVAISTLDGKYCRWNSPAAPVALETPSLAEDEAPAAPDMAEPGAIAALSVALALALLAVEAALAASAPVKPAVGTVPLEV